MPSDPSVTGRDGYIIAKALLYAVTFIDSLPKGRGEISDRDDMVALLCDRVRDEKAREQLAQDVERKTGILPDITDWKVPHR